MKLSLPHGDLELPVFMPDATWGYVRGLDATDLKNCGIKILCMNVAHLMQHPGSSVIKELGGLHKMAGWDGPIVTDSGGFQIFSMIKDNAKFGSITKKGMIFRPLDSERKFLLTPEKSIQLQLSYGADIVICLDWCTHPSDSDEIQKDAVERTIEWAKRCKDEFERQKSLFRKKALAKNLERRPLIFSVAQGGRNKSLRKECISALLEIGFDGYSFGGYPVDENGNFLMDILKYCRDLVPEEFPMFALGIGSPEHIPELVKAGYGLFDCALPTRDARQGRLYVFAQGTRLIKNRFNQMTNSSLSPKYIYIKDDKHSKNPEPLSSVCDCLTCSKYSVAYLHHLYKRKDYLYVRLATIHNLRFMSMLMEMTKDRLARKN